MNGGDAIFLLKQTVRDWGEDKASRLSAALAYYAVFSIPPLLLLILVLAGQVFGAEFTEQQLQNRILDQFSGLIGAEGADVLATTIENASRPEGSLIATIVGFVTLLFGAAGLFTQMQDALNTIWEVAPDPKLGLLGNIKKRLFSFTLVLGIGFLLLVSLVLSAVIAVLDEFLRGLMPSAELLIQAVNFVISFGVVTVLFGLIFKVIPDAQIAWKDVWVGAAVTALLFTIGKWAIGLYLGNSAPASTYGAAGSLVVFLLWTYYSANILFFGAEFTQVYANKFGSRIVADETAIPLTEESRAQQGIPRQETKERAQEQAEPARPAAPSGTSAAQPVAGIVPPRGLTYPQPQEMVTHSEVGPEKRPLLHYLIAAIAITGIRRFLLGSR